MPRSTKLPLLAGCALTATVLAGCRETMPRPDPTPPRMCTMEYVPVCASRGWKRKTFGNACQARAEGYRVIRQGPCAKER